MAEILVVDDDADIRSLIRMTLESYGYSVREASDGHHALEALEEHAPDAMVLDVMMPRMDGLQLVNELKADPATATIPVILLSAKAQADDVRAGIDAGADAYVTKPFEPLDLLDRVVKLIG